MKKILSFIAFALSGAALSALPFNSKLSPSDLEKVNNGEIVIRNIDKYKNISIKADNYAVKTMLEQIDDLDPNYLAEIIQVRPYEGNEDLIEKLNNVCSDIPSYAGIPYWSVRHQRYWDLYKTAELFQTNKISDTKTQYNADLYMEPFGTIHSPITIEKTNEYFIYSNTNNNTLSVKGISCIKKRNMKSMIILFRDGDNWILYGIGGCKAPKIAMFQERIETSFINRIKTFCNFVFEKI